MLLIWGMFQIIKLYLNLFIANELNKRKSILYKTLLYIKLSKFPKLFILEISSLRIFCIVKGIIFYKVKLIVLLFKKHPPFLKIFLLRLVCFLIFCNLQKIYESKSTNVVVVPKYHYSEIQTYRFWQLQLFYHLIHLDQSFS